MSCPVRPSPLTPHFLYIFYRSISTTSQGASQFLYIHIGKWQRQINSWHCAHVCPWPNCSFPVCTLTRTYLTCVVIHAVCVRIAGPCPAHARVAHAASVRTAQVLRERQLSSAGVRWAREVGSSTRPWYTSGRTGTRYQSYYRIELRHMHFYHFVI